jgi:hypothetical protein
MKLSRRKILLACQIAVSAILITWLVHIADPASLWTAARQVSPQTFSLALALAFLANGLAALRQWIILRAFGVMVALPRALALNWFGLFANNFLPSSVGGDAAIAAVLQRDHGRLVVILAALILNRIFGLASMVVSLVILFAAVDLGPLQMLADDVFKWSLYLLIGIAIGLVVLIGFARSDSRLSRFLGGVQKEVRAILAATLTASTRITFAGLFSFVVTLCGAASFIVLAGYQPSLTAIPVVAIIWLMLQLIQMIPISFNGIGVAESALTFCLTRYGWQIHEAVLLGLALRVVSIIVSLPGAVTLMLPMRKD